ncbi:endonuclease III [Candidatus Pacearchaeota archaeon]|nr:endonuclease III [Candidatus Pacearchaeota archaeon]
MNSKRALKHLKILSKNPKEMRLAAEDWKNNFEILISTIMSARTRDEVTIPTAEKLFKVYFSAKTLGSANLKEVMEIVKPINFYKTKSKNIIACAKMLHEEYKDKVPITIEELIKLPGVGRKTANVFISELGRDGLAVDTHVSYISQKLGWTKNQNPRKIEEDLKKLFQKKYWNKINGVLVRFGKTHTSKREKDRLLKEIKRIK